MRINRKGDKNPLAARWLSLGLSAALLMPLASASLHTAWAEGTQGQPAQGERVLRIGNLWSGEDDTYFRQQFTDLYELQHPGVRLEIVPAVDNRALRFSPGSQATTGNNVDNIRKLMGGNEPIDVVIGDSTLIGSLSDHNLLQPLQPLIDRDHYDLSNLAPTMLDGVRELGHGHLYALAPTFYSSALFYNKDIFDTAGVPYPTNGMSWSALFDLAAKVTKVSSKPQNRVYGFSMARYAGDPYWDMLTYASPLQLSMYDSQGKKMTVNSPAWQKVWTSYSELVKKQVIPGLDHFEITPADTNQYNPLQGDLFLEGRTAMMVGEFGYLNELADVKRYADSIPNNKPVNWGVVTVPSHVERPGVAAGTWLNNMMAISATAQNKEDAWDLIKFVNSNEVARIKAHNRYELTSRQDYIQSPVPGLDLKPFYSQKPLPAGDPVMDELQADKPGITQISDAGRLLFIEVYKGHQTVSQALKTWEYRGNSMLEALRKDPNASFDLEDGWLSQGAAKN